MPLFDFDRLFGTWLDYKEYKAKKDDAKYKASLAGADAEAEAGDATAAAAAAGKKFNKKAE